MQIPENPWSTWDLPLSSNGAETCQLQSYTWAFFEFWAFLDVLGPFLAIFGPKNVILKKIYPEMAQNPFFHPKSMKFLFPVIDNTLIYHETQLHLPKFDISPIFSFEPFCPIFTP